MDNPVVLRVTEVCGALGFATLRFNFRGVGSSTGAHDEGRAEVRDVEAALGHLRDALGSGTPLALAGYSFGAIVAARVPATGTPFGDLAGLALIAPPLGLFSEEPFAELGWFSGPLLVAAGSQDEYCPLPALDTLAQRLPGAMVKVIDGANHFFAWAGLLEAGKTRRSGRAG